MINKKLLPILLLSLFILLPSSTYAFTDIPIDHPYFPAIELLEQKGAITEKSGEFKPDEYLTQQDFLKMALSLFGYNPEDGTTKKINLRCRDLKKKSPYFSYFKKAVELNLLSPSGLCEPKRNISKLYSLKFLFNLTGTPAPKIFQFENKPRDVDSNAEFAPLISQALKLKLITGDEKNRLQLFNKIKKGEAANLLYRFYAYANPQEVSENLDINSFPISSGNLPISISNVPKIEILLDVLENIQNQYYFSDQENLNSNNIVYKNIESFIGTLKDPFTDFITPENAEQLNNALSGEFQGIGVQLIQPREGEVSIINVIRNSPAEKAGLKVKDIFKEVEHQPLSGLPIDQVVTKIRGEKGTPVHLKIYRPDSNQYLDFSINRDSIYLPPLDVKIIDNNIAYFELNIFGENTAELFEQGIKDYVKPDTKGIIIDLRNNPGGLLDSVNSILGHFIPQGSFVNQIKSRDGKVEINYSSGPNDLSKYPLVVLINESSASASEIFAIAIKDYKIGTLVGAKSYGKGTVQELRTYYDNSILKFTVAEWLSPLKNSIDKIGVIPDIEVINPSVDNDAQLDKAIELIKSK